MMSAEQQLWKTLFEHIRDAAVVLDRQRTIIDCNSVFMHLVKQKRPTILGQTLDMVLPLLQAKSKLVTTPWNYAPSHDWVQHQQCLRVRHPDKPGDKIPLAYRLVRLTNAGNAHLLVLLRDRTKEQELIELRSEFVSIVSHQLRTPASAVKWYLETLIDNRRGKELNDWQQDKLHQAYQSNERMISLINDLLNVSRLDSGKFVLKPIEVSLVKLFNEVQAEVVHFAHAHNVEIMSALPADLPTVSADIDKMREVVLNLVTNAIKYSQSGHRVVKITASVRHSLVTCAVQDQGIGIPKKDQIHIFEKFFRADNAIESQTEGSGLGLYIAREIIRLHGGDIKLTSTEGVGTTVYFSLPIYAR